MRLEDTWEFRIYTEYTTYMNGVEDQINKKNIKNIEIIKKDLFPKKEKIKMIEDLYIQKKNSMWRLYDVRNSLDIVVPLENTKRWAEWCGIKLRITQETISTSNTTENSMFIEAMGFEKNNCMINYIKYLWEKYGVKETMLIGYDLHEEFDMYSIQHAIEYEALRWGALSHVVNPQEFKKDIEILNGINEWIGHVLKITNYKEVKRPHEDDEYHTLRRNIIDEVNDAWDKHKDGMGNVIDLLNTDHHQRRVMFTALHAEEDRTKAYVNYIEE